MAYENPSQIKIPTGCLVMIPKNVRNSRKLSISINTLGIQHFFGYLARLLS